MCFYCISHECLVPVEVGKEHQIPTDWRKKLTVSCHMGARNQT